jgi:hypothetical protein
MKHTIILLSLALLAACDLCDIATQVHRDRCEQGDLESCKWLDEHATAGQTCLP